MILEFLLSLVTIPVTYLGSLMPKFEVPSWVKAFDDQVNSFLSGLGGMGVWVPWSLLITVVGVVLVVWAASLSVQVVRALVAHVPMIGGRG